MDISYQKSTYCFLTRDMIFSDCEFFKLFYVNMGILPNIKVRYWVGLISTLYNMVRFFL